MSSIGTKFVLAQRFVFDPNNNSLVDKSNGNELNRLGSNESRILLLFSERPNQIITRDELHEFVWREQGFRVDDSSLTQAISTLRKILQDSTKAPKFVKTVPKRGYQFIASVEKIVPLSSSLDEGESEPETIESAVNTLDTSESHTNIESNEQSEHDLASTEAAIAKRGQSRLLSMLILLIALLLPIFVYLSIEPAHSKFRLLEMIEDIPLRTTENHPPLNEWEPLIAKCVETYLTEHTQKPIEIIATAGPNNNLILNYVHSELNTAENITIQLIAKQHEMTELCKK